MASGLPVVTTDVGGVREFVADGAGGAVVPPRDAAALAAALETVSRRRRSPRGPPARTTGSGRRPSSPGGRARCGCSTSTIACCRRGRARPAHPHEGRDSRRRHVLLHRAGDARARLSRRLGSRAGLPGDGAVRDRLRARRHSAASTGTRARRFRSSAEPATLVPFLKDAGGAAPRHDRAARLHASGLSRTASSFRRRRIRSVACATACEYLGEHPRRADLRVRAAAQRVVEARPRGGRRRRPQHPRIVSVVPAVDAPVGSAHARPTGGACARIRASTGRTRARSLRLSARAALRAPRGVRLPQPGSGHDARRAGRRLRGSAPRRRRLLPGDALLGSRRDDERRAAAVSRSCGARTPDVRFVAAEELFA